MTDPALSATAEFRPLPTVLSGAIALVAAAVAAGLIAETAAQRTVLAVAAVVGAVLVALLDHYTGIGEIDGDG